MNKRPQPIPGVEQYDGTKLLPEEEIWAGRFEFLKSCGYLLRPRYRPGWVASWIKEPGLLRIDAEDGVLAGGDITLDAMRISDGETVFLKRVPTTSPEVEVGRFLSSDELKNDRRNHSAPVLEVLEDKGDPEHVILVLPMLRPVDMPPPASIGELVDFVHQTLEGLCFLHEHNIAHRDCAYPNIMMDARALFPTKWHPQALFSQPDGQPLKVEEPSRTAVGGVRYYFVDFGISTRDQDKVVGVDGQERAPELSSDIPYDPYKLDVYGLGRAYKTLLEDRDIEARFLDPLIELMTKKSPGDRPSAAEAFQMFKTLSREMSWMTLSRRLRSESPGSLLARTFRDIRYRMCELWWALKPKRPLPPLA